MRRRAHRVFDDEFAIGTVIGAPIRTAAHENNRLGAHDQLAIQVVLDQFVGPALSRQFSLDIEESLDGAFWNVRDTMTIAIPASQKQTLTQMWSNAFLASTVTDTSSFFDGPLLGFIRFSMYFDHTDIAAHAKVFVSSRE